MNTPFRKSKVLTDNDRLIEEKLVEYINTRYKGVFTYNEKRISYAVRRFVFQIAEPDLVNNKMINELSQKLDMVLAAVNCRSYTYKDKLIINVPREEKDILYLGNGLEELMNDTARHPGTCYIGECDDDTPARLDFSLSTSPHLIIAGATGSGKSVALNALMLSLMYAYTPKQVNFYIIDQKNELSIYKDEPHVISSAFKPEEFFSIIADIEEEYRKRNEILENLNIDEYNKKSKEPLAHLFIIFDEADSVLGSNHAANSLSSQVRDTIKEITAQGRSRGMHIILASQKPEKRNIDTNIRSNIPGKLALRMTCQQDSRLIIGKKGAETLTGNGDAILMTESEEKRVQCAYTSNEERMAAIDQLRRTYAS